MNTNPNNNTIIKKVIKCERAANNTHWDFEIEITQSPTVFAKGVQCGGPQHEDKLRRDLIWKSRISVFQDEPTNNQLNVRCLDCANFILNELVNNQNVQILNPQDVEVLQQALKDHAK